MDLFVCILFKRFYKVIDMFQICYRLMRLHTIQYAICILKRMLPCLTLLQASKCQNLEFGHQIYS